jgi:hypothetical protein
LVQVDAAVSIRRLAPRGFARIPDCELRRFPVSAGGFLLVKILQKPRQTGSFDFARTQRWQENGDSCLDVVCSTVESGLAAKH